MLCDELWMMCVKSHQQDLRLEAARHALQRSALAQMPRLQRSRWRGLCQALHDCRARLYALGWRWRLRPADASAGLWDAAEALAPCQAPPRDLAMTTVPPMPAAQPASLSNAG